MLTIRDCKSIVDVIMTWVARVDPISDGDKAYSIIVGHRVIDLVLEAASGNLEPLAVYCQWIQFCTKILYTSHDTVHVRLYLPMCGAYQLSCIFLQHICGRTGNKLDIALSHDGGGLSVYYKSSPAD